MKPLCRLRPWSAATRVLLILWVLVCTRASASAADDDNAGYKAAIGVALERYGARDWEGARAAFEQAHALLPSARTLRGIALCAYYARDYVAAGRAFERAFDEERNPLTALEREQAAALLDRVYEHVARVQVHVEPVNAAVRIGAQLLQGNTRPILLAPGGERLEIALRGYVPHVEELELAAGQQLNLHVQLAPEASPLDPAHIVPPPARVGLPDPAPRSDHRAWSYAPWIAAGATIGFAIVAASFGVAGHAELKGLQQRCQRAGCTAATRAALWKDSPIETYEILTNVSVVAASASAASAVTLFLLVRPDSRAELRFSGRF